MTFIKEQIVGSTPSTGMLEDEGTEDSVTSLLSATLDANIAANVKCQQISGDLSKLVDQEKEEREAAAAHTAADIIALNKESKEFFRVSDANQSTLNSLDQIFLTRAHAEFVSNAFLFCLSTTDCMLTAADSISVRIDCTNNYGSNSCAVFLLRKL